MKALIPEVRAGGQGQGVSRDGCCQETTFADVGGANMRSRAFRLQQHSHWRRERKSKQKLLANEKGIHFEDLRTRRTVSDFLKVSGLNEIRLHDFEPPKELSDEDHHIVLWKVETQTSDNRACIQVRLRQSGGSVLVVLPLTLVENTTSLQA